LTTIPELEWHLKNKNKLCDLLIETFLAYTDDHYGWAKELWDVGAIAYFVNPDWFDMEFIPSPKITDDIQFISGDTSRHAILAARYLDRNGIMKDMYKKLSAFRD
jgi:purine nucleosidase